MNVGGLFDGCGLLAYGLHLAGLEHRWLCEVDEFRQGILRQRFPGIPVYPDVRAVDADAPRVDLIAGGFPCKGISSAGLRTGFDHPESALWREMYRVIRDLRPRYVLVENVADLLSLHRGAIFGEVVGSLAEIGYDSEWDCFPAAAFGAPHGRDRVFLTAVANPAGRPEGRIQVGEGDAIKPGRRPVEPAGTRASAGIAGAATDAERGRHAPELAASFRLEDADAVERHSPSAAHASGIGERDADAEADALAGGREARAVPPGRGASAPALPGGKRWAQIPDQDGERGLQQAARAAGRGVAVEWREFEPAIRRWEELAGRAAPEPLVRRVDDGSARRVERSRLSALGDGVLVQAGWLCGRRILDYERERLAA